MQQTLNKTHLILYPPSLVTTIVLLMIHSNLQQLQRFYTVFISCTYFVFWPPPMCQYCQQSSKQSFQTFSIFSTTKWQKINFTSFTNYYRSLCQTLVISKEMSIQLFHFETKPWQESFFDPGTFFSPSFVRPGHNILCPVKWLIIEFLQPGARFFALESWLRVIQ